MIDRFAEALRKYIRDDMNNYTDDMATGLCADFASYQKLCGVIQGLAIAERHLIDLVAAYKKEEDSV